MTSEIITHNNLCELAATGAIHEAAAVAHGSHWSLVIRYGGIERVLAAGKTKKPRSWAHLDSLVRYLAQIGIRQFTTDAHYYDLNHRRQKDSKRSDALHEAVEHDRWFRQKVQEAMDDPRPAIPHAKAMAQVERELTHRIGPRPE